MRVEGHCEGFIYALVMRYSKVETGGRRGEHMGQGESDWWDVAWAEGSRADAWRYQLASLDRGIHHATFFSVQSAAR